MKVLDKVKNLPSKVKKQLHTALLLLCAITTFAVPAFGGGYNILKDKSVISSAAAIEDVDLLLVAASAFGEARKVMNATDNDAKSIFTENTTAIVGSKWQNIGLLVGAGVLISHQLPYQLLRYQHTETKLLWMHIINIKHLDLQYRT